MPEIHTCSICGKHFTSYPCNPDPLPGEECCPECDNKVVLPIRIFLQGMMNAAMVITPKNSIKIDNSKARVEFKLKELQELVGGYIEVYPECNLPKHLAEKFVFLVDEEGRMKHLEFNNLAEQMFDIECVGNLVIIPRRMFK